MTGISGLRVVDLAGPAGVAGTKLLADLGADVIRIEPPAGDPLRERGPFYQGRPGAGRGLPFAFYNASKRSIVLDLEVAAGRVTFRDLVLTADVVVETASPGALDALNLGYAALSAGHPGLIWASITPFGPTGPRASWQANDLVAMAAGGVLFLSGYPERPPLAPPLEQAYHLGGAAAVTGILMALHHRAATGRGQRVDVSLQEAVATATENTLGFWDVMGTIRRRTGAAGFQGFDVLFPCRDGWVVGIIGNRWENLVDWAAAVGVDDEGWRDPRWLDRKERESHPEDVSRLVRALFAAQTMDEITTHAQLRRIAIQPVNTIPDLFGDRQLASRGYWTPLAHDDLGATLTYPGAPFQSSSGFWQLRRRAPLPGEHTAEILTEIGGRRPAHPTATVPGPDPVPGPGRPLAGIRIVDFTQSVTGPLATRILADHGAEVIKIEWGRRPDGVRLMIVPRPPGNPSVNVCATWNNFNASKRDLTVNMNEPAARKLVRRLIAIADVVVDNYGVDPLPKWGLTYDEIRTIRPDIIMARSSVVGRSGPRNGVVGFGYGIAALSGWSSLMGFPGDPPVGLGPAYPDTTANCHHLLIAILTALEHRCRCGSGQYIDLSQVESTAAWIGPAILDYTAHGRVPPPAANRHPDYAPHGVYPAAGDDDWIAIAVDDGAWPAFRVAVADPALADPRFASHAGRKAAEDDLDAIVAAWTRDHDRHLLAEQLQAHGVAAAAVATGRDLVSDPQLAHRGHFVALDHPEAGRRLWERHAFRLSDTPGEPSRSPLLGEDNDWVLHDLLGLDDEQIAAAYIEGVID